MHIKRVCIDGFKRLTNFELELDPQLNILVGNNETGKSTILEAINLALSRQLDGRSLDYALDPYLFNTGRVAAYFAAVRRGECAEAPRIQIELYLGDDPQDLALSLLLGSNNSRGENCPGISLCIEPDTTYTDDIKEYAEDTSSPELVPVEYYRISWLSFGGASLKPRSVPCRAAMVDTTVAGRHQTPSRYVAQTINDLLEVSQRHELSLAYKKLRHAFVREDGVAAINTRLAERTNPITDKELSVQMDMSPRSAWEGANSAHLDNLPFGYAGKGEQCRVQMRLAILAATGSRVLLIEEPENHLSHSNLNVLLDEIGRQGEQQQVIVTTHSAFVLNKLGLSSLRLISPAGKTTTLAALSATTRDYFMKLPGYDTLRLLLAKQCMLVEGPSDELVVQRAYQRKHGRLPIHDGVDVISVGSLAFKRFLEIAHLLKLTVRVVTDNDGNVAALKRRYGEYLPPNETTVSMFYDEDEQCSTLEPQLLKANSLRALNDIFETSHADVDALGRYMRQNKTDCALRLFETEKDWKIPEYIARAVE